MSQYQVQRFSYRSNGGYVCYPKVSSNDRTWDARSVGDWNRWTLDINQNETVDLINDAGFSAGDIVFAAIDVVAGNDATAPTMFTVTQNGKTASFDATGTTLNTGLTYNGTK